VNRSGRTCAFRLAYLAFDQRAQIPAAVGLSGDEDARSRQADSPNDDARLKQLPYAVGERDVVDDDDRVAVTRQRDVAELDPTEQRAFEPSDVEPRCEVLVRLPNDLTANQILGPAGLQSQESHHHERQ